MKKLLLTILCFLSTIIVFGQNGLRDGNLFILLKDLKTISLNSYENNQIKEKTTFPVNEKSIFTTDQKARVAILDTSTNEVLIYGIQPLTKTKLSIPFDLQAKSILLNDDNLFVGGEMGKEMLIQYHLKSNEWYPLEIPTQVLFPRKSLDDLVVNDSLLIAIDDLIMPKYILFYKLNPTGKLTISHFKELKSNGTYESIIKGRITSKYLGLLSGTYSGYSGASKHITIYNKIGLERSFVLSTKERSKNYYTINDFLIIDDRLIIATKEKGIGTFQIKPKFFTSTDRHGSTNFNVPVSFSKVKHKSYENGYIRKLTAIPKTTQLILTIEDKNGRIRHEILSLK